MHGALRRFVGEDDKSPTSLTENMTEPHVRGAILVSAIFAAFLTIYKSRCADLIRLATNGSGVLPAGDISVDLANRLASEASKTAAHVLNMSIRALDYCPPVNLEFGDFLRAIITADRDLVRDDDRGYRVAFIDAFRRAEFFPTIFVVSPRTASSGSPRRWNRACWLYSKKLFPNSISPGV